MLRWDTVSVSRVFGSPVRTEGRSRGWRWGTDIRVHGQRSWRWTSVGISNPDKRLRSKVSESHLNRTTGGTGSSEKASHWARFGLRVRVGSKGRYSSWRCWASLLLPRVRPPIHQPQKIQLCPPSLLCHQIFSAWSKTHAAIRPKSPYTNWKRKWNSPVKAIVFIWWFYPHEHQKHRHAKWNDQTWVK